jgi:hypothetical protein
MAYCIADIKDNKIELKELENVNLNCSKIHQDIIDKTIEFLDYIMTLVDINIPIVILIEVQMTSIMKCIQTVINTYFKLLNKYEGLLIQTLYLSPKHKLNLINKYKDFYINNDIIKNNKYKQNKIDSILFTKWLLENKYKNDKILHYFNDIKKKDDISDALLMIIFYYEVLLLS